MSAKPFQRPEIFDNPIGWGPSTTPAQFDDLPYAPFGKGDKLGKVADWTAAPFGGHQSRFQQRGGYQGGRSSTPTEGGFGYVHEEDEGDFKLVDTSAKSKQKAFRQVQRGRWGTGAGGFRRDRRRGDGRPAASAGARRQQAPRGKRWRTNNRRFGGYGRYGSDQKRALEPSVEVKSDWRLVDQYDFSSLTKLNSEEPPSDDLVTCGSVQVLDKSYSAVSTKTEKPLERIERTFFKVTTSDDPIIRELVMQEGAGNVFATDAILACLMACPRSVYSWDIVIQRVGSKLFFDKRDNSHFDFLTVNETAHDMLYDDKDGINSPANLSEEATFINQNFSQQILQNEKDPLQRPNPFQEGEEDDDIPVASTGYRYRRFHLNDEVDLVVRCEVDAVLPKPNPEASRQYVTIKALNEYEPKPGVEWRQKLDTQRGAVLATELKNNAFKLAQWCAQSILAGSDQFVLGYVSRVNPKDSYNHTILGLQSYKPTEFANQINLNIRNMWGILKGVIDTCMQLPEGKFLLLKDPNKAMISLYAVPQDAFDDLDDDTEASDELIEDEAELEEDETDDENYA